MYYVEEYDDSFSVFCEATGVELATFDFDEWESDPHALDGRERAHEALQRWLGWGSAMALDIKYAKRPKARARVAYDKPVPVLLSMLGAALKVVVVLLVTGLGGCYRSHEVGLVYGVYGVTDEAKEVARVGVERWNRELGDTVFGMVDEEGAADIVVNTNHLGGPELGRVLMYPNACHVIVYYHRDMDVVRCVAHEIMGLCIGLTPERDTISCVGD